MEAGESLSAIHEEEERQHAERSAERLREILNSPEPKDKTSSEWRYWKLRHLEADFGSGDAGRTARAWREFFEFFDGFRKDKARQTTHAARQLLPNLIIAMQEAERGARGSRKRRAKK